MTKMCPLIKIADPSYPSYCSENGCAWWDDECKCCCVKSLIYNKNGNSGIYQAPPVDFGRVTIPCTPNPYEITCSKNGGNDERV